MPYKFEREKFPLKIRKDIIDKITRDYGEDTYHHYSSFNQVKVLKESDYQPIRTEPRGFWYNHNNWEDRFLTNLAMAHRGYLYILQFEKKMHTTINKPDREKVLLLRSRKDEEELFKMANAKIIIEDNYSEFELDWKIVADNFSGIEWLDSPKYSPRFRYQNIGNGVIWRKGPLEKLILVAKFEGSDWVYLENPKNIPVNIKKVKNFDNMTVADLKEQLLVRNLSRSGNKEELLERLRYYK